MKSFGQTFPSTLVTLVILASLFLIPGRTDAQFTGEIHFRAYDTMESAVPDRTYRFLSVPNRISLESSHSHSIYGSLLVNRFLVRGERGDFVFLNRDHEALAITKEETESLARLIRQMRRGSSGQNGSFDWNERSEVTGRTQTIHGYPVEEIRVFSEEPGRFVSVWLTEEIKVDWGILQEVWQQSMSEVIQVELPMELFMNRNSFPLLIEYFEAEVRATVVETVAVERGRVDRSRLEVPHDAKMLGISDLMMRFMRGGR